MKVMKTLRSPLLTTRRPFFSFLCSLFPVLCFLFSCKSLPETPDVFHDGYLPLEPGAYVYVIAEKDAMPVLNQFMFNNINNVNDINNKQFQQMIDATSFAAAAVYAAPGAALTPASRYRLAAWGSYPASRAKIAFGAGKEWKKQRSAVSLSDYWHSPQRGISIALTGRMALIATSAKNEHNPPDPHSAAPGVKLPEGFAAFHEGSILSCWLDNPAALINQKLEAMGIPLEIPAQQLFINLVPAEKQRYTARLQIQLTSANQARALSIMLSLARNFLPPELSANLPVQDGNNLNITTVPLSAGEIALLLKMFSL